MEIVARIFYYLMTIMQFLVIGKFAYFFVGYQPDKKENKLICATQIGSISFCVPTLIFCWITKRQDLELWEHMVIIVVAMGLACLWVWFQKSRSRSKRDDEEMEEE